MSPELERLAAAAVRITGVMEQGERDPLRSEQQELDDAVIAFGRAVLGLNETNAANRKLDTSHAKAGR